MCMPYLWLTHQRLLKRKDARHACPTGFLGCSPGTNEIFWILIKARSGGNIVGPTNSDKINLCE